MCDNSNTKQLSRAWRYLRDKCDGKHLKMCKQWNKRGDFISDMLDMGWQPDLKIVLKSGVRYVSPATIALAERRILRRHDAHIIKVNKQLMTLTEYMIEKGCSLHYSTVYSRLQRGWSLERAITSTSEQGRLRQ